MGLQQSQARRLTKVGRTPTTTVHFVATPVLVSDALSITGAMSDDTFHKKTSETTFTILCGHVEDILLLNKFFFRLSICALVAKI